ncbi:MAG: hypothetical protein NC191_03640 [Muribaculaceae bacterium]|nr:hypothetical protein [Muribaculaceae bacterium]
MNAIQSTTGYPPTSTGKNKTEQVAAGVGGAAGITASATKMAGKRGLVASENSLASMLSTVTKTAGTVTENAETATSLWGKFKLNTKIFTIDLLKKFKALENKKFIGAIFKSPLLKKAAGAFGVGLAFFVLVSGVNKAAQTTVEAAGDIKNKLEDIRA